MGGAILGVGVFLYDVKSSAVGIFRSVMLECGAKIEGRRNSFVVYFRLAYPLKSKVAE